jgi:hypothetical protein
MFSGIARAKYDGLDENVHRQASRLCSRHMVTSFFTSLEPYIQPEMKLAIAMLKVNQRTCGLLRFGSWWLDSSS